MTVKIILDEEDEGPFLITLPRGVLEALGWLEGDELTIDVPTTYPDQLVLYKAVKP